LGFYSAKREGKAKEMVLGGVAEAKITKKMELW